MFAPKKMASCCNIQPCLNFISHVLWQMTKIMCAEVWIKIFIINNYRKVCWAIHCKGYRDRKSYFTYTVGIFGKFILNLEGLPIWAIFHMLLKWRIPWEACSTTYEIIQCIHGSSRVKGVWGKGREKNINKRFSAPKLCKNGEHC